MFPGNAICMLAGTATRAPQIDSDISYATEIAGIGGLLGPYRVLVMSGLIASPAIVVGLRRYRLRIKCILPIGRFAVEDIERMVTGISDCPEHGVGNLLRSFRLRSLARLSSRVEGALRVDRLLGRGRVFDRSERRQCIAAVCSSCFRALLTSISAMAPSYRQIERMTNSQKL